MLFDASERRHLDARETSRVADTRSEMKFDENRVPATRRVLLALLFIAATLGIAFASPQRSTRSALPPVALTVPTFGKLGNEAVGTLVHELYDAKGLWRDCPASMCEVRNHDWGSDSLTETLFLRWRTTRDPALLPFFAALSKTERLYDEPCRGRPCTLWSDVPMWDSVAASREYEAAPENSLALAKAKAAFDAVEGSDAYAAGACPSISYQRPNGRGDQLKTLETDSNAVKAALLLYAATHDGRFLRVAISRYAAIRRYFLDPEIPLYSVYVFDDGRSCVQIPHRFFASVNGNMIWNGIRLHAITGRGAYRDDAVATASAVDRHLSDAAGVFSDLQAENDLEEPLVEAMFELATLEKQTFARQWLLTSAAAAYSARKADGTYGRFFDGPPPVGIVTAWQTNGGLAAEIAAASLQPQGVVGTDGWRAARFIPYAVHELPATLHITGSGIALIGTIGEICCQPGHARILVDGVETVNGIGTWQNKSSAGHSFPDSVLFAWRWPAAGNHVVTLLPGVYDAKEGGTFLDLAGYLVR